MTQKFNSTNEDYNTKSKWKENVTIYANKTKLLSNWSKSRGSNSNSSICSDSSQIREQEQESWMLATDYSDDTKRATAEFTLCYIKI